MNKPDECPHCGELETLEISFDAKSGKWICTKCLACGTVFADSSIEEMARRDVEAATAALAEYERDGGISLDELKATGDQFEFYRDADRRLCVKRVTS